MEAGRAAVSAEGRREGELDAELQSEMCELDRTKLKLLAEHQEVQIVQHYLGVSGSKLLVARGESRAKRAGYSFLVWNWQGGLFSKAQCTRVALQLDVILQSLGSCVTIKIICSEQYAVTSIRMYTPSYGRQVLFCLVGHTLRV